MRHLGWLLCCLSLARATPPLGVQDGGFAAAGQPVGLVGVNLYQGHMMWARLQNVDEAREALAQVAALGFNCVRLPLNGGLLMPAPGMLPDDPGYAAKLKEHGLNPGYPALLDQVAATADKVGVWVLPELHEWPGDAYRWFTGGEEKDRSSGRPGGGLSWAQDPATWRQQAPRLLAWLAARWRGRTALAGFEVPYNEPHGRGDWERGDGFKAFAGECARAVKQADPQRLVFLATGDWGAGVNELSDSFVWDLAPEIDALAPHFYLGMHSKSATIADAYGVAPASWLSWYRGAGKPLVVGEYGPAHSAHPQWQTYDDSDQIVPRLHDACLAGWYANGVAGALRWAWDKGIDDEGKRHRVGSDSLTMLKYLAPLSQAPHRGRGAVAVVLDKGRRSQYGQGRDLLRIAAALLNVGAAPFDSLFEEQVVAQPAVLSQYRALLVYQPDLAPAALAACRASGVPRLELADDALPDDRLRIFLRDAGLKVGGSPVNVWAFEAGDRLAVFNRTAEKQAYSHEVWTWQRVADRLRGELLPVADDLVRLELPPFGSRDLALLKPNDPLPALAADGRPRTVVNLPVLLPLYDHGPTRGRWAAGWSGGEAQLLRSEEGREVLQVRSNGRLEAGGFNFDNHQPVELLPWREITGASLDLLLRLTSRGTSALQVELHGANDIALATLAIRPSPEWQQISIPLAQFEPRRKPTSLQGVFLRLLPEGSVQVGAVWLTRPVQ
ncbi:MAG: cellulase family glycosylhydrolase [Fimbriimonadaceae bacterium]|nr:cellulase family glycosylhydrolase [Fimbriimonadaceae bacterium]